MSSKYLVNGTTIGGHYEIIDVLGEDDFEILYLVKNIHRDGSFFVIKELFLEVFSERKGNNVETIPEALGVFNKRKAEIITELDNLHRRHIEGEIKVFAYFEENGTIYSCMAYTPNAKVEDYLQFEPKEDTKLPLLEELVKTDKEKKKGSSLLLIGAGLITVAGGFFLLFNHYGEQLESLNLFDNKKNVLNPIQEKNDTIKRVEQIVERPNLVVELNKTKNEEKRDLWANNFSLVDVQKKESISVEKNITKKIVQKVQEKVDEINMTKKIVNENNLIKKEEPKEEVAKSKQLDNNLSEIFSERKLQQFLKNYMKTTSHASSKKIMKLYDNKITRYFQFKNITPKKVGKSVRAYNRKWKYRNFKLVNFKVLKRYSKDGLNYCDVKTRTKWYVSNPNGKKSSGHSKGFMTLKDTKNGIKVKAIYGVK